MKTRRLARAEQPGFEQAKAQVRALGAQPAKTADSGRDRTYPGFVSGVAKSAPAMVRLLMDHLSGNHF
jgi:hypothetical protein